MGRAMTRTPQAMNAIPGRSPVSQRTATTFLSLGAYDRGQIQRLVTWHVGARAHAPGCRLGAR
jgi:hypothetical protein